MPRAGDTRSRQPIHLLLVDDHVVFRAGLCALLQTQPDLVVVGEAGTGSEAVQLARVARPDVVLMDLAMPGKGGIEATRRIVALGLGARVLVLTALAQEQQLCDDLTRAIRAVADHRLFLDEDGARLVTLQRYRKAGQVEDEQAAARRLSGRDRQVLALVALGHSSKEIARKLSVSPKTVDVYRARLKDQLGFRGRPDLVRFALRTGLLAGP